MFLRTRRFWKWSGVVVGGVFILGLAPLVYAEEQPEEEAQVAAARARPGSNSRGPEYRMLRAERGGTEFYAPCLLEQPGQVHRYAVTCPTTRHIDVRIADCCVAGDHWEVTVRSWDPKPNRAVANSPGGEGDYSTPARVYTYSRNREMRALIECRYLHGVGMFPADADLRIETGGSTCTVEDLGAGY